MDGHTNTSFEDTDFGDAEWLSPNHEPGSTDRMGKFLGWVVFLVMLSTLLWTSK